MSRPSRSATTILGDRTTVDTLKMRRVDAVTPKRLAMRMSTHVLVRRFVGSHRGCICCIVSISSGRVVVDERSFVIYGRIKAYQAHSDCSTSAYDACRGLWANNMFRVVEALSIKRSAWRLRTMRLHRHSIEHLKTVQRAVVVVGLCCKTPIHHIVRPLHYPRPLFAGRTQHESVQSSGSIFVVSRVIRRVAVYIKP